MKVAIESCCTKIKGRGIDKGDKCAVAEVLHVVVLPDRQSGKMDVTTTKRSMSLTKGQNKLKLDAEPRQCVFCMQHLP